MEKVKEYLKDKGIGFYATLAASLLVFVTMLVYAITFNTEFNNKLHLSDIHVSITLLLATGFLLTVLLPVGAILIQKFASELDKKFPDIAKTMLKLIPWVLFGCTAIAFTIFASSIYTIYLNFAAGRFGLEPLAYVGVLELLVLFFITFFLTVVPLCFSMLKQEQEEVETAKTASEQELEKDYIVPTGTKSESDEKIEE